VSTPTAPREVGYFLPPDPTIAMAYSRKASWCTDEDALVDTRGYIYVTDKNQDCTS